MPRPLRGIFRTTRNWRTKRNFEVFTADDFLAATVEHIPNQEIPLGDGRVLVLDGDPGPPEAPAD